MHTYAVLKPAWLGPWIDRDNQQYFSVRWRTVLLVTALSPDLAMDDAKRQGVLCPIVEKYNSENHHLVEANRPANRRARHGSRESRPAHSRKEQGVLRKHGDDAGWTH